MTDTPAASSETTIRHEIDIAASAETAFAVVHERWDEIKPRDHNPGTSPVTRSVFEPKVGGALYDELEDGSQIQWSRVLVFDRSRRFVISWDLDPQWKIETDPARCSEVEVTFTQLDDSHTRVTLEHRHLDRHGPGWEAVRAGVMSSGGWPLYLSRFAEAVGTSA